jgi:hypothetical protein
MLRLLFLVLGAAVAGWLTFALLGGNPLQVPAALLAAGVGALLGWCGGFLLQVAIRLCFLALVGAVIGAVLGLGAGLLLSGDTFLAARLGAILGALFLLFGRSGRTIRSARAAAAGSPAKPQA